MQPSAFSSPRPQRFQVSSTANALPILFSDFSKTGLNSAGAHQH
jgi:hypothetical protein